MHKDGSCIEMGTAAGTEPKGESSDRSFGSRGVRGTKGLQWWAISLVLQMASRDMAATVMPGINTRPAPMVKHAHNRNKD